MSFTYHKARGKIYHEPNPCRSWGLGIEGYYAYCSIVGGKIWGVGIISLPFSRKEIDGHKVPSKYTTDLLLVFYKNSKLLVLWWLPEECRQKYRRILYLFPPSFLLCNQIWLNYFLDDCCHFGYGTKSLKQTLDWATNCPKTSYFRNTTTMGPHLTNTSLSFSLKRLQSCESFDF
jgi:hypothetical protein